jgi:tetratricopeptide (TPR) repeat protein
MVKLIWAMLPYRYFAVALLHQALTADVKQIDSWIAAGRLHEAELAAREQVKAEPASPEAHALLGYILFKENNPIESLAQYAEAARYGRPSAADLEVIGSDYFLMEDYATADKWLARSVDADPNRALALYLLGRVRYNRKHFDEAAELFERALKLEPGNGRAQENLGLAFEQLGKVPEAIQAYSAAISLENDQDSGPAYLKLGMLLVATGHVEEAIPQLAAAVRRDDGDAKAHRELGKAYLSLGKLDYAEKELQESIALDPQSGPTYFLLANVYRRQGRQDKAQQAAQRYGELTGTQQVTDDPLAEARVLAKNARWSDAEQVLRRYLRVNKNSAEGHYLLGYVLLKLQNATASLAEYTEGAKFRTPSALDLAAVASDYVLLSDYPDADKWFSKSLELDPNNAQVLYYLGRTKYEQELSQEAADAFRRCLKIDPSNADAHRELGRVYLDQRRFEEARSELQASLRLKPGVAETEKLLNATAQLAEKGQK